eukprot:g920.t1
MPKGVKKRRKTRTWRKSGSGKAVSEMLIAQAQENRLQNIRNDLLFVVDKGKTPEERRTAKRKRLAEEKACDEAKAAKRVKTVANVVKTLSRGAIGHLHRKEKRAELALLQQPTAKTVFEIEPAVQKCKEKRVEKERSNTVTTNFNVWGNDTVTKKKTGKAARRVPEKPRAVAPKSEAPVAVSKIPSVEVPKPGESYHPSLKHHTEAISLAVASEERIVAMKQKQTLLLPDVGNHEETLLIDDSQWSESDEEEEEENDRVSNGVPVLKKLSKRKTRQQRNRHKRHLTELKRIKARKEKKRMLHEINNAKKVTKELKIEEETQKLRRKEREEKITEKYSDPSKALPKVGGRIQRDYLPTPTVPLSTELHGSLRLIESQSGLLMKDRMESLLRRGKFELGDRSEHRKREKNRFRPRRLTQSGKARKVVGKERWGLSIYGQQQEKNYQAVGW